MASYFTLLYLTIKLSILMTIQEGMLKWWVLAKEYICTKE